MPTRSVLPRNRRPRDTMCYPLAVLHPGFELPGRDTALLLNRG